MSGTSDAECSSDSGSMEAFGPYHYDVSNVHVTGYGVFCWEHSFPFHRFCENRTEWNGIKRNDVE